MGEIMIKNSLTGEKEEFKPLREGRVLFYHCGPTVYWTQHIGNLRGMTCGDLIVRSLRYMGHEVVHVRNYTDVGHLTSDEDEGEDKMEKAARREVLSPRDIADKYIEKFERDVNALNIEEPTYKPRATDHIQEMQDMIQTLLDKGYAYTTELAVYFNVSRFPRYDELSGQDSENKKAGAGAGEVTDPQKKDPRDFALWFFKVGAHKNALQVWRSPFHSPLVESGEGFPGWHIECSAMSKKYLGDTLDIHMGGVEHIPVHHTNEIAQSEAANDAKFVNYWLHNGHLLVNEGKMAKSEGTGLGLDDVVEKVVDPMVLRYFFLQAHYRSKQNFTEEAILNARSEFHSFKNRIREISMESGEREGKSSPEFGERFRMALADDFNTPSALAITIEMLRSKLSAEDKLATLIEFDKVLGLGAEDLMVTMERVASDSGIEIQVEKGTPSEIQRLAIEREEYRWKKDYREADALREKIESGGYQVHDGDPKGPVIFKFRERRG